MNRFVNMHLQGANFRNTQKFNFICESIIFKDRTKSYSCHIGRIQNPVQ